MKAFVVLETVMLVVTYVIIGFCLYGADDKDKRKEDWKTFNRQTNKDVLLTFDELMKIAESNPHLLYADASGCSEPNGITCFIVQRDVGSLHTWHVLLDYKDYKKYIKWLKKKEDEALRASLVASHKELEHTVLQK